MKRELQGQYVTISTVDEKAQAFVPAPLPPNPSKSTTLSGVGVIKMVGPHQDIILYLNQGRCLTLLLPLYPHIRKSPQSGF